MENQPEQMTVEEYAAVQGALGNRVEKVGRIYWTRVRGFFHRPMLPYEAYAPAETMAMRAGWGGFQHVVPEERDANSWMSFLMLDELPAYDPGQMSHNRRRLIKNAAKQMEIRAVHDLGELQEQGFAAYLSFYRRTGYQYLSDRRRRANFSRWAATLLRQPKTLLLGAYGSAGLAAVSVSFWVAETLLYATFFSDTEALRQGAGELMFHALRQIAGRTSGLQQVFVRRYQGGSGMDQYYLLRGAKLIRKPARLQLQPAMRWALKCCLPRQYAILRGTAGAES